jgi:hypothetical protein
LTRPVTPDPSSTLTVIPRWMSPRVGTSVAIPELRSAVEDESGWRESTGARACLAHAMEVRVRPSVPVPDSGEWRPSGASAAWGREDAGGRPDERRAQRTLPFRDNCPCSGRAVPPFDRETVALALLGRGDFRTRIGSGARLILTRSFRHRSDE